MRNANVAFSLRGWHALPCCFVFSFFGSEASRAAGGEFHWGGKRKRKRGRRPTWKISYVVNFTVPVLMIRGCLGTHYSTVVGSMYKSLTIS